MKKVRRIDQITRKLRNWSKQRNRSKSEELIKILGIDQNPRNSISEWYTKNQGINLDPRKWPKFEEVTKIWGIDQNLRNWPKSEELIKIQGIDQNKKNGSKSEENTKLRDTPKTKGYTNIRAVE